jgi:hypothetical protein
MGLLLALPACCGWLRLAAAGRRRLPLLNSAPVAADGGQQGSTPATVKDTKAELSKNSGKVIGKRKKGQSLGCWWLTSTEEDDD